MTEPKIEARHLSDADGPARVVHGIGWQFEELKQAIASQLSRVEARGFKRGKLEAQGGLSAEQVAAIRLAEGQLRVFAGNDSVNAATVRRAFPSAFSVAPAATPERARDYDVNDAGQVTVVLNDILANPQSQPFLRKPEPAPVPPEPPTAAFIQRADDPPSPPATLTVGGTAPPERTAGDPYPTWLEWAKAHPAVPPEPVLGDERATWIEYTRLITKYLSLRNLGVLDDQPWRNRLLDLRAKLGLSDRHEDLRAKPAELSSPEDTPRFRTVRLWAPILRRRFDKPFVRRSDPRQPVTVIENALLFDSEPTCDKWVRDHGTDDYATASLELKIAVDTTECGKDRSSHGMGAAPRTEGK